MSLVYECSLSLSPSSLSIHTRASCLNHVCEIKQPRLSEYILVRWVWVTANERQSLKWNGSCSYFGKGARTDVDFPSYCMRIQARWLCVRVRVVLCSAAGVQALCVLIGRTPDPGAGPPAPRSPHWQHWEPKKPDKTGTQEGDRMRPFGQSCIIKEKKKSDSYVWWGFGIGNPGAFQFCC